VVSGSMILLSLVIISDIKVPVLVTNKS